MEPADAEPSGRGCLTSRSALPTLLRSYAPDRYSGAGVTLAMLDAGFTAHPDLVQPDDRILAYHDATAEGVPLDGPVGRWQWHGTMTTVVAAGSGYLSEGQYRGLAYRAGLVLVKVASDRDGIDENSVTRGLEWVLRNRERYNIRVVNISVGALDEDVSYATDPVDQMAEEAVRQGLTLVVAAGNTGTVPTPPANTPDVITVGGVSGGKLYGPSAYGETADGILKPELVAAAARVAAPILPGTADFEQADALTRLSSCTLDELPDLARSLRGPAEVPERVLRSEPEGIRRWVHRRLDEGAIVAPHYKFVEGTSFAAPLVASTVALMLEANPDLTPAQVKQILAMTADRLPGLPPESQGFGQVNPRRAVELAEQEPHRFTCPEWFTPPHLERGGLVFQIYEPTAARIELAADFNGWDPAPMRRA
ncbi:MAG: S8 family serine peptidase, partial [Candidatus Eremiobacterota bacterium]